MSHPFILVFRFPPESPLQSADIEDDIAEALGNDTDDPNADHVVDGNEIGKTIDIFVHTRYPTVAFEMCKPLLDEMNLLDTAIVAFRSFDGDSFSVLHPSQHSEEFLV